MAPHKGILIIKVGTSTLTKTQEDGKVSLDSNAFQNIASEALALQKKGYGIVIVSSAAIAAGITQLHMTDRPTAIPELQRLASIGWRHILNTWATSFGDKNIGELLLTKQELDQARERNEFVHVAQQLLINGDICVINENDAITHTEITFGDNDTLAGHVASRLQQSALLPGPVKLLILSDIQGVYADKDDPETLLPVIEDIEKMQKVAKGAQTKYGTGGMATKFLAAKIAHNAGVETWIGKGKQEQILSHLLDKKTGTHFPL